MVRHPLVFGVTDVAFEREAIGSCGAMRWVVTIPRSRTAPGGKRAAMPAVIWIYGRPSVGAMIARAGRVELGSRRNVQPDARRVRPPEE